jgi:hypothetical protein
MNGWRDGRVAEGDGLLNRYTAKSRIGGSNPPLSATLILLGYFGFYGLVATPSGNKSIHVWGYLPVSFRSGLASILHRSMKARMLARWKSRAPFIRLGSRIGPDRMKPFLANS